jgi:hypothetical protein
VVSLRTQPMFSLRVLGDYWQIVPENDLIADSAIRNILITFFPEIYHSQESPVGVLISSNILSLDYNQMSVYYTLGKFFFFDRSKKNETK